MDNIQMVKACEHEALIAYQCTKCSLLCCQSCSFEHSENCAEVIFLGEIFSKYLASYQKLLSLIDQSTARLEHELSSISSKICLESIIKSINSAFDLLIKSILDYKSKIIEDAYKWDLINLASQGEDQIRNLIKEISSEENKGKIEKNISVILDSISSKKYSRDTLLLATDNELSKFNKFLKNNELEKSVKSLIKCHQESCNQLKSIKINCNWNMDLAKEIINFQEIILGSNYFTKQETMYSLEKKGEIIIEVRVIKDNSFTKKNHNLKQKFEGSSINILNDHIYLIGGIDDSNKISNQTFIWNVPDTLLIKKSAMHKERKSHSSLLISNSRIVVCGGKTLNEITSSCELYDINTDKWHEMPNLNESKSNSTLCWLPDNQIYCIGGWNKLDITGIESLNLNFPFPKWGYLELNSIEEGWKGLQGSCAILILKSNKDNSILIFGGMRENKITNECYELNLTQKKLFKKEVQLLKEDLFLNCMNIRNGNLIHFLSSHLKIVHSYDIFNDKWNISEL